MTNEELAQVKQRMDEHIATWYGPYASFRSDYGTLLSEIERLYAENAALHLHGQEVSRLTAEMSGTAIERRDQVITRLRAALSQIRDEAGKVCEHYETCEHESCASSYAAWAIADAALAGQEYPA